jgi:hypothetical protein
VSDTGDNEIRFACPTGAIGSGVDKVSLKAAMALKPHFVAADAGTIDAGPSALGSGECAYAREAVYHDLDVVVGEVPEGVPIVIGSAGTAGGDPHVDWTVDILKDILAARGLKRKVVAIKTEQDKDYLKQMIRSGRVRPLDNAPTFDEARVDGSTRVVGMMGVEPIQAALAEGADIVIAGRSSDSALFAAYPMMKGIPAGLSWHMGKIVECGTLVCETARRGTMFGRLYPDHAIVTPIGENLRCTPQSVAAHSLYENGDPYIHAESSGALDLTDATFEQFDDVSVKVAGAGFRESDEYTVKLEGVELVGYQTVIIGGIRDPLIIRQLDNWLAEVKTKIEHSVAQVLKDKLDRADWRIDFHVYGRNAVMGAREPLAGELPHEVGLVVTLTAPTQEVATKLAELSRQPLLHHPIPEWSGAVTTFACLFNKAHIERGPVWRFCVNHVVLPHTQSEMFRMETIDV